MVIGVLAGTDSRLVAGSVSTRISANSGMKSATGWSSRILPSPISIIAAMPVIGLVME